MSFQLPTACASITVSVGVVGGGGGGGTGALVSFLQDVMSRVRTTPQVKKKFFIDCWFIASQPEWRVIKTSEGYATILSPRRLRGLTPKK